MRAFSFEVKVFPENEIRDKRMYIFVEPRRPDLYTSACICSACYREYAHLKIPIHLKKFTVVFIENPKGRYIGDLTGFKTVTKKPKVVGFCKIPSYLEGVRFDILFLEKKGNRYATVKAGPSER